MISFVVQRTGIERLYEVQKTSVLGLSFVPLAMCTAPFPNNTGKSLERFIYTRQICPQSCDFGQGAGMLDRSMACS